MDLSPSGFEKEDLHQIREILWRRKLKTQPQAVW